MEIFFYLASIHYSKASSVCTKTTDRITKCKGRVRASYSSSPERENLYEITFQVLCQSARCFRMLIYNLGPPLLQCKEQMSCTVLVSRAVGLDQDCALLNKVQESNWEHAESWQKEDETGDSRWIQRQGGCPGSDETAQAGGRDTCLIIPGK